MSPIALSRSDFGRVPEDYSAISVYRQRTVPGHWLGISRGSIRSIRVPHQAVLQGSPEASVIRLAASVR